MCPVRLVKTLTIPQPEKRMYSTHEGYNDSIHGYYLEDLKIGMSASHAKTVT